LGWEGGPIGRTLYMSVCVGRAAKMPSVSGKVINQKRETRERRGRGAPQRGGGASRTFAGSTSSCKEEPWQTETLPSAHTHTGHGHSERGPGVPGARDAEGMERPWGTRAPPPHSWHSLHSALWLRAQPVHATCTTLKVTSTGASSCARRSGGPPARRSPISSAVVAPRGGHLERGARGVHRLGAKPECRECGSGAAAAHACRTVRAFLGAEGSSGVACTRARVRCESAGTPHRGWATAGSALEFFPVAHFCLK
jgi:hypothetical protein